MWLVDLKDISISSGMGGEELPPSCNFFSAIFYSLPPKRDFLSARITPKCLNSAVLTGQLIRAPPSALCPTFCFPAGIQAQSVPRDTGRGWGQALHPERGPQRQQGHEGVHKWKLRGWHLWFLRGNSVFSWGRRHFWRLMFSQKPNCALTSRSDSHQS